MSLEANYLGIGRKRKVQFNTKKNGVNSPKVSLRETMLTELGVTLEDPYVDIIYTKNEIIIKKSE